MYDNQIIMCLLSFCHFNGLNNLGFSKGGWGLLIASIQSYRNNWTSKYKSMLHFNSKYLHPDKNPFYKTSENRNQWFNVDEGHRLKQWMLTTSWHTADYPNLIWNEWVPFWKCCIHKTTFAWGLQGWHFEDSRPIGWDRISQGSYS